MGNRVSNWFKERINMEDLPFFRTPDYMYHVGDWLGALVAAAFFYTVISGLIILLYYDPAAGYKSTETIINEIPYGSVVLYSHLYGAYAMIILAYVHMFRNYFVGAYKKPRELVWILGVLMLALTLGASFLGYSLIGDVLAVSAVDVGAGILGSLGLSSLVPVLFGNYSAGDYTRVLAMHIILVALIGLLFLIHFFLADVQYGMMPSRKVKDKAPAVYPKSEWQKFNPWWPRNFIYMMSLIFLTWGFILIIPNALVYFTFPQIANPFLNPKPAPPPNSPAAATVTTYPPWFFLFVYKIADFPGSVLVDMTIALFIPIIYLLLVPFIDRSPDLHPLKRRVFTWIGILMMIYLIQSSLWGDLAPGVPVNMSEILEVYLPPAIITGVGLFLIPWEKVSKGLNKGLSNPPTMLAFTFITLAFASSMIYFLTTLSLASLAAVLSLGSIFAILAKLLTPYVMRAQQDERTVSIEEASKVLEKKKRIAQIIMIILFIVAIPIVVTMWTIPPTGYYSNLFGVDLGVLFLILGEEFSLYHYVVYKKPVEKEE